MKTEQAPALEETQKSHSNTIADDPQPSDVQNHEIERNFQRDNIVVPPQLEQPQNDTPEKLEPPEAREQPSGESLVEESIPNTMHKEPVVNILPSLTNKSIPISTCE